MKLAVAKKQTTHLPAKQILDWIDREIAENYAIRFEKPLTSDILLELRHHFSSCPEVSLNQLIFRFHNLLPKVEKSHYLLCYRIRQILSKNYKIELSDPIKRVEPSEKPLALTMRSLEFEKKRFFESSGYSLPYSDIRVTVLESRK